MKIEQAQEQIKKHDWLLSADLTHKVYDASMHVTELDVAETTPGSNDFYVRCHMKGKLGRVSETLTYVLKNYHKSSESTGC